MNPEQRPELQEQHIARLLQGAPEPRLSPAQRDRLRTRLVAETRGVSSAGASEDPVPSLRLLDVEPARTGQTGHGKRGRARVLAAAAALLVVLTGGFGAVLATGEGDDVEVATSVGDDGEPGADPNVAVANFCSDHAATFRADVETWDGVENWSYLTDSRRPAPDLVESAVGSLEALRSLRADPDIDVVLDELGALRAEAAGSDGGAAVALTSAERVAHADAVRQAIATIDETIVRNGWQVMSGCD